MSTYSGVLNKFSDSGIIDALLAQRRKMAAQGGTAQSPMAGGSESPQMPPGDVDALRIAAQRQAQPTPPPTLPDIPPNLTHDMNATGVASPDRRIRNQSGQELYGADARDILPGPATDAYEDTLKAGPPQKHGFLAHLAGIGKGFLMGGPVGMVAGGISPNLIERANYNLHTLPMAEHRAAYEQQQQAAALGRKHEVAGMTGMYNGEPSLPYKEFQQRQDALNQQREWTRYLGERRANTADVRTGGYLDNLGDIARHREVTEGLGQQRADQGDRRLDQGDVRLKQTDKAQALRERAQSFREKYQTDMLGIAHKRAEIYERITHEKGEESPEAEAFRKLHDEGKIDERGLAPNPKWQAEYNSAYETWKNTPGISEEEARTKAEARANRQVKEGKTIPVTELDEFKGLKASIKARPKTGQQSAPRKGTVSQADIEDYAKRRGVSVEQAKKQAQAEGYQIQ